MLRTMVSRKERKYIDVIGFYHTCSVLVDAEFAAAAAAAAAAAGSTYNHDDDMP